LLPRPPPPPLFPYTTLFRSPQGGLDGSVQLHPGDVALVVVVAEKRLGALLQEDLERGLGGELGGLAQERSSAAQLALVLDAVGRSEEHTSELQSRENLVCRL